MMLFLVFLATALSAPSFAMPVKYTATDCGASSGHYQSSDVVPAQPHTGQVFKVTNHFTFDGDVSGGQFDVKVTALGGIPLKHQTGPLCGFDTSYDVYLTVVKVASVTVYGSQCPIAKGPADISYDIKLASILPPALGNAAFHLTAKDQKGTDIVCVKAHLGIVLENSTESKTGSNTDCSTMACNECAESKCASQVKACRADSTCASLKSCFQRCKYPGKMCAVGCTLKHIPDFRSNRTSAEQVVIPYTECVQNTCWSESLLEAATMMV